MSSSFKLNSHPQKALFQHLQNVGELSKRIVESKYFRNSEMHSVFIPIVYLIGISHDFGKSTTFFQAKLHDNTLRTKKAQHGEISAFFGYFAVRKYLENMNLIDKYWYLPTLAWIVIKRHHGDIHNLYGDGAEYETVDIQNITLQASDILQNNIEEVNSLYEKLFKQLNFSMDLRNLLEDVLSNKEKIQATLKQIRKTIKRMWREQKVGYYFYILFFYSVLLDADKLDASETKLPKRDFGKLAPDLVDKYKSKKFTNITNRRIEKIRERAYENVVIKVNKLDLKSDRILSISLPTGAGKTLTSISFALKLRDRIKNNYGFVPRIIYCLPFLSIIDQNASVIEDIFRVVYGHKKIPSNLFLKHHHLAEIEYKSSENEEENIVYDINQSLLLTEGWYSEFVITTFVQFFHSLITNRNRAARKFHNIINSIIILDEVQAFPVKYWKLFREILKFLAYEFNTWIIFISATQPLVFEKDGIKELVDDYEQYFKEFDRYKVQVNLSEVLLEDFVDTLLQEILTNPTKNYMIVLNTISSARKVYESIKTRLLSGVKSDVSKCVDEDGIYDLGTIELIYLSTHILPMFRLKRINRIKQKKGKQKIIVTTQLIEAGVDISVDVIYRDLAPLDSIVQTAGRCNRDDSAKKGLVKVICLRDKKTGRAYWSYIYDPILIDATKQVLQTRKNFSERNFVLSSVQQYYQEIKKRKSQDNRVFESVLRLYFTDIQREFRLIEERIPKVQIFVEINADATNIRTTFENLLKTKDRLARIEQVTKIKKALNEYTIQVGLFKKHLTILYHLPSLDELELFRYIPHETIERGVWYKKDIGFIPPEEIEIIL
ncbi:MAG: CRISPR-associated endonuclease Cas3'' [Candidatus Heimdallarchaeaceae archaeon]